MPTSTLKGMVGLLKNEQQVSRYLTCPFDNFFNENKKTPGKGGGEPGQLRNSREGDPTKLPQPTKNPTIPPLCVAAVNKLKSVHPGWTITKFAAECGITTHQFVVGDKGGCTNYQLLGICTNKRCIYKHVPCTPTDTKQKEVAGRRLEGLKVVESKKAADKS